MEGWISLRTGGHRAGGGETLIGIETSSASTLSDKRLCGTVQGDRTAPVCAQIVSARIAASRAANYGAESRISIRVEPGLTA